MDSIDRKHLENLQRISDQRAEALANALQRNSELEAKLAAAERQNDDHEAAIGQLQQDLEVAQKFIEVAFDAHPNLDLDIAAIAKEKE